MIQLCPPQVARSKMIVWTLVPSWYDKDYNVLHCSPFAQRDSSSLWTESFSTLITISRSCCLVKELCDKLAVLGKLAANTLKHYFLKVILVGVPLPDLYLQAHISQGYDYFLSLCFELGWGSATLLMVPYLCGNLSDIFQQKCRFKLIFWVSKVLFILLNFVMLCKRRLVLHVNYCSMSWVCAALPLFHLHKSCFMKESVSESVS